MSSNTFDRFSFLSLFFVVVLLPVFCLPFSNISVETSKGLLLVLGLTISVIFWIIARLIDGKIVFPKSWLLVSGFSIVLVFFISALFSSNSEISLFGSILDVGSFYFIFSAFVLMLMSSIVFRNGREAKILLFGVILSSVFVLLFQIFHLFLPTILSLGILSDKTSNILGSWNAFGLFAGFSTLMFLLVIEFFSISKTEKLILSIFILLSILLGVFVNFPLIWLLLGISSLMIFVYKISLTLQKREEGEKKYFPIISFVVVILSLLFFMSGSFVGSFVSNRLGILNTEVGPSFNTTVSITKNVLVKHPILGIGPNRFNEAWSMYKPESLNQTQFWDVSFNVGSGLLPTITTTTGSLGIFAWLVFLLLFLFIGIKSIFFNIKNTLNWEMIAFFMLSLYLFVSSIFYFTGSVMFLLAFVFTGVLVGLISSSSNKEILISFFDNYKKSLIVIFLLVITVIFSVIISFKYLERFISVSYFNKSLSTSTIAVAEDSINKALSLYSNDLYLRTYSQIYLLKLNSLVKKDVALSDSEKIDLQTNFDKAVNSGELAVKYNPSNYLNFQLLGSVYQQVGSIGVKDVYEKAIVAFQSASKLNPLNPGIKLAIANTLFLDGKIKEAKEYANTALSLKGDYVDALITLSKIAKSEGNNSAALSYGEDALSLNPTNKNLIEYVNSLKSSSTPSSVIPTSNKPKQ